MGHYFIFFYRRNDLFTPATLNPAPQFSFESSRARLHFTSSYCIFLSSKITRRDLTIQLARQCSLGYKLKLEEFFFRTDGNLLFVNE